MTELQFILLEIIILIIIYLGCFCLIFKSMVFNTAEEEIKNMKISNIVALIVVSICVICIYINYPTFPISHFPQ
jgi:hypothetical protein